MSKPISYILNPQFPGFTGLGALIASRVAAAIVPHHPRIRNVNRFGDPRSNMITGSETSQIHRPQCESRIAAPPTPQIRAALNSAPSIATSTPAPAPAAHPTDTPTTTTPIAPLPAVATLTKSDKLLMLMRARDHIHCAMIVDDAVPVVTKWDEMVAAAINAGMRSVTTNTRIQVPTSATKDVIGAMSAMRHAFKQHIIPQVNREFGLRLESGSPASGIEYRRDKVKHLLTNFNFL
ncbi:hypothetical protein SCLCIDRAFT_27324 [Scleroderma citrinum Foug A]|uniref:Uncharacterized protein n=1 Tax=Scleroderma citrinum Foug A TaxID=1036808 RepID=A0A0C3DTS8_9AGAM|nr:hypothetical protein SCLCIDRAFT_27324 [Scleroderma citrinum Foug A]